MTVGPDEQDESARIDQGFVSIGSDPPSNFSVSGNRPFAAFVGWRTNDAKASTQKED